MPWATLQRCCLVLAGRWLEEGLQEGYGESPSVCQCHRSPLLALGKSRHRRGHDTQRGLRMSLLTSPRMRPASLQTLTWRPPQGASCPGRLALRR
ncbi:hypothetical protein RHMOL_Rhmol11G0048200 [Rhododendron molle]|uniref:Uncharacterized protein n=1 Tax=Rhododendron molle TaxID=49168 RepID=A0ACC0LQB9_RHOML|nr:hypothetical protein RHMOL_Rhmol11G0048200 [Rhododendron molle]